MKMRYSPVLKRIFVVAGLMAGFTCGSAFAQNGRRQDVAGLVDQFAGEVLAFGQRSSPPSGSTQLRNRRRFVNSWALP